MKNMKNIQEERKQIRRQLDEAYNKHDENEIINAAQQLIELAARIMNN